MSDLLVSVDEARALRAAGYPQLAAVGDFVYSSDKISRCIQTNGKYPPEGSDPLPLLLPRRSSMHAWLAERGMHLLPAPELSAL